MTEDRSTFELTLEAKGGAVVFSVKLASPGSKNFVLEASSASSMSLKLQAASPLHRGASSSEILTAKAAREVVPRFPPK
jgi:hypothetical protein